MKPEYKYRLEEIKPTTQTLADVPEGEPVDCVFINEVVKRVRIGNNAHSILQDGSFNNMGFDANLYKLWRPAASPAATTDQLEDDMVAVDADGMVWFGLTRDVSPIASPIYRVVEVKP